MSNSERAITAENISKIYRIGIKDEFQENFVHTLVDFLKSPYKNYKKYRSLYRFDDIIKDSNEMGTNHREDIIWALRDVSFTINRGEVVGVIGLNGAGKSTLLKILCGITAPTSGRAEIKGRISSLLEVGTGFHPELTGRENVYLNGTILGMRKQEIDKNFDEIVAFSEIEKFIDTPVKRYSSGMKVRLAFAVSAHMEPEILLIDEVLAVGDSSFQKKCLNKMEHAGNQGQTALFVSHSMAAVTRLCERSICLKSGMVVNDGPSDDVVGTYLNLGEGTPACREWPDIDTAPGDDVIRLCSVRIVNEHGQVSNSHDIRQPVGIRMEYYVNKPDQIILPYFKLVNDENVVIFSIIDQDKNWVGRPHPTGLYTSTAWIPGNLLSEGPISVHASIRTPHPKFYHFLERDVVSFQIIDSLEGDSARGNFSGRMRGAIRPMLNWNTTFSES